MHNAVQGTVIGLACNASIAGQDLVLCQSLCDRLTDVASPPIAYQCCATAVLFLPAPELLRQGAAEHVLPMTRTPLSFDLTRQLMHLRKEPVRVQAGRLALCNGGSSEGSWALAASLQPHQQHTPRLRPMPELPTCMCCLLSRSDFGEAS